MKNNNFLIVLSSFIVISVAFTQLMNFSYIKRIGPPKISQKVTNHQEEAQGCELGDLSGNFDPTEKTAYYNGRKIDISNLAYDANQNHQVLSASTEDRWIEVDLSDQMLYAWDGGQKFLESKISSGLPGTPTPTGEFRIWIKLRATRMEGGSGRYYYNLPNVPFTMFFYNDQIPKYKGYGLHGTYWHNDFGRPHSHGCVNLPTPVAEQIYYWASPAIPDGKNVVYADDLNLGTRVIIHE